MRAFWIILLLFIFKDQYAAAMHKSDVAPGTLVQLRYTERTKRKQFNPEVIKRAERLHNVPAVVMERPFWDNGTRFAMLTFKIH